MNQPAKLLSRQLTGAHLFPAELLPFFERHARRHRISNDEDAALLLVASKRAQRLGLRRPVVATTSGLHIV
jgi:hypothetical protein